MDGVQFGPWSKDALREKSFVVLDPEQGDEGVARAKEKNTQDPRECSVT